jgi:hypothetical protein
MYPPRGAACGFHAAGGSLIFFSFSSWSSPRLEEVAMNVATHLDDLEVLVGLAAPDRHQ